MNRSLYIALILAMLCSCSADDLSQRIVIQESSPGVYEYEIIDGNGKTILSEIAYRIIPTYKHVSPSVISLDIGIGTAFSRSVFYDTETDALSAWIYDPIVSDGSMVAYISEISTGELAIVIQRVFSEEVLAVFVRDFSPIANYGGIVVSAEICNENELIITYLSGPNFDQRREILQF